MGTRHLQKVINKNGVVKINQYGQWDGYPSGQGKEILIFLKTNDLNLYQEELDKIYEMTEEENKIVNEDKDWKINYPQLDRSCGSDIHYHIINGNIKFIYLYDDQEAKKWCEGFYTIDFQNNKFIAEFYDIKKSYNLNKLPSINKFLKDFKEK